jgi:NAD(P)-dependent dehydrogenase (short-subunit alcohol dehydrogenase family)
MDVLITGISKGLGLALAKEYFQHGDNVFGISRSVPVDLPEGVRHQSADITLDESKNIIENFVNDVPCIDVLINNAGCGSNGFRADDVEISELSHQIQLHCIGTFIVIQAVLPKLHKSVKPKVINITSRLGSIRQHLAGEFAGRNFSYPYRIAKCAQNMLTVCMAEDHSLDDIVIAAINPGLLKTDSGSIDAKHTAEEAAHNIIALIQTIEDFGIYHAFNEKTYF